MRGRAAWIVLVFLAVFPAVPLCAQESEPPLGPSAADREALREIVRQEDVRTVAERPGFSAYVKDLGTAGMSALARRLESYVPGLLSALARFALVAAQVIFVTALALLALLLLRAILDNVRRRRYLAAREPAVVPAEASDERASRGRSREAWAEELRRRLAEGDAAAACEALWWWLARGLAGGDTRESWTSRELLAHARRFDLAASVRRLDRMIYGASRPAVEDVRRLWNELEEGVG